MQNLQELSLHILDVDRFFKNYAARQINYSLTMRNWLTGFYIVEYEQSGKDRASYGEKTLKILSSNLKGSGVRGFSDRNLRLYRQFYLAYPEIWQFLTTKFQIAENQMDSIWQLPIAKLEKPIGNTLSEAVANPMAILLSHLSFTHFIELLRVDNSLQRTFYEIQCIKNDWTVKELNRNINSLLFERIGLSFNKEQMLQKLKNENLQQFSDIIKSPYILEFLEIEEKSEFSESDLEQSIIDHLQKFLIELGRGFCFEARQKRITFNNKHYKIDLVFYHRILKCHVLIDLKLGEFDHADAGQMNLYLNYMTENEMSEGDRAPIGIILCSQKDSALVHYATGGLAQEIFVSKYKLQLPSERALKSIIEEEVESFKNR